MRITTLELWDYKCFRHLILDDLGDRVVPAGPNGCGKSAILEAIAALKEFIGTYNSNQHIYFQNFTMMGNRKAWPAQTPVPVRADQEKARIRAELLFEGPELQFTGNNPKLVVGITIQRSGEIQDVLAPERVEELFRHFDPFSGIGVVDYIGPFRTFPLQKVQGINIGGISNDRQRIERIELQNPNNQYAKFASVKQFIISMQLEDLSERASTGHLRDSLKEIRDLFIHFFGPKELIGYRKKEDEMIVAVKTPFGDHDIDQLSSGEKEIFSIFVNLFRIRSLPSIILYDEPERHLNSGLESRIIPAIDKLQTKNQIWIATHGIELIGSVPMADIIALRIGNEEASCERFRDELKSNRVRVFESLGAKVGLQLSSNQVVFLEGKDSHADKRIIDRLAGPHLPGVLFVASGSSKNVMGAGTRAGLIIENIARDTAFIMVIDRDYRDGHGVAELEKKLQGRVMLWGCHEVENILLHNEYILNVLRYNGNEELQSTDEVRNALMECAKSLEDRFVIQWAAYQVYNKVNPTDEETSRRPLDEEALKEMAKAALKRAQDVYSDISIINLIDDIRTKVRRALSGGSWDTVLPGKEILQTFRTRYLSGVQYDTFKEQIVSEMVRSNHMPHEVQRLCSFVRSK